MDERRCGCAAPFSSSLAAWAASDGAFTPDGDIARKPGELAYWEVVIGLCERFHCLPSQLMKEDAALLRGLKIVDLGRREVDTGDGE